MIGRHCACGRPGPMPAAEARSGTLSLVLAAALLLLISAVTNEMSGARGTFTSLMKLYGLISC